LAGARAVLIRGAAGAGKSRLALELIQSAACGAFAFARLVADDRVHLEAANGRLIVRPPPMLAGLIEVRGVGIRQLPHEPMAVVSLVIDLGDASAERLPGREALATTIEGITLPRFVFAGGTDALPAVLAALTTREGAGAASLTALPK
jgi:serine kinase of HPr protein (carbohydrate metabolism regulator)